jgi:hypothetical protein
VTLPGVPATPQGWTVTDSAGLTPFTTSVTYRLPDGTERQWSSRTDRKRSPDRKVPGRTWAMAVLFAIGSACFVAGALPAYAAAVSPRVDALTFFVGSLFFTSAAWLAFAESSGAKPTADQATTSPGSTLRLFGLAPHRIDWWSTAIQLVGTVAFNVTTLAGVRVAWTPRAADVVVWTPDAVGSICFLLSSYLAFAEVCHGPARLRQASVSWWVVVANLAGSAFFGLSALGAWVVRSGQQLDPALVNAGTVAGGVCFFVGAVLLVPEARRCSAVPTPPR